MDIGEYVSTLQCVQLRLISVGCLTLNIPSGVPPGPQTVIFVTLS
jgi:hypothetical protein